MIRSLLIGAAVFAVAAPAAAQTSPNWTGFYAGGRIGYVATPLDTGSSVLFDRDLNGSFGDTITTVSGANAFSPGFCNGQANGPRASDGCNSDSDGLDYAVHAGADYQFGSIVVGGLVEYGRSKAENSVTAFSTTPASYTLTREMRGTFGLRGRVGVDIQGTMPYVTAGVVRAKVRSSQNTSNMVNAFSTSGDNESQNGYRVGGGFETRVGPIALGALYLFTNVKDDDFRVNVTRGTAGATNPFILGNANGTQFRRSDDRFKTHSALLTASYRF
jgi:outer membrane immunogenic protein